MFTRIQKQLNLNLRVINPSDYHPSKFTPILNLFSPLYSVSIFPTRQSRKKEIIIMLFQTPYGKYGKSMQGRCFRVEARSTCLMRGGQGGAAKLRSVNSAGVSGCCGS